MILLYSILGFIFALYLGWFWFVAAMGFKAAKDAGTLTKNTIIAAYPGVILGFLYDLTVLNILGSIYLLDSPIFRNGSWNPLKWNYEFTLTSHLTRLKNEPGLKGHKAKIICKNMLDPFQIGGHCR